MLDKEVVKYTRDGIQQTNLATGDTKMLTESEYAREIKYTPAENERVYRGRHSTSSVTEDEVPVYRPGARKGTTGQDFEYTPYTYGRYSRTGNGKGAEQTKYYYSAKVTGDKIQTHADLRSSALVHINKRLVRKAGNAVLNNLKESDNAALKGAGTSIQSAIRMKRGFHYLHSLWNRDSLLHTSSTIKNTEYAAAKNSAAYRAAYAKQNAARAAKKASQETAKQTGKVAQAIGKAVVNPATIKAAAIVGAILLILYLITQSVTSAATAVVGSVTDHPELIAYVMQLDTDFQEKITALKESYDKEENTDVSVDGEDLVNTDPNALAILATGDWTDIDLSPESKEKLSKLHAALNTYSVTTSDETRQETSSDGKTVTNKTVHHVKIQIRVFTAKEKIDTFGFTPSQKSHVLEMLDFLDQINAEAQQGGTGIGNGGQGSVAQGEFIWAVPGHSYISSGYGTRVDPINGQPSAFHTGLDIPAPTGTSVVASADGTVIRAGVNGGFGNCVIIQHHNGIQTLYGHNSALLVKVGDVVKQGQVIAKVGQTGRATGPHCHFEFRINGKHVDPAPYLKGILGNEE